MEDGKMEKRMETDQWLLFKVNTGVTFYNQKNMVGVNKFSQMEMFLKEFIKMDSQMEKVYIVGKMEFSIMDNF